DAYVHQRSVEVLVAGADPWFDRLDQRIVVEILGGELGAAAHAANPRIEEFLAHLFRTVDWNPAEFVGYRIVLEHPLWSTRTTMAFEFTEPDAIAGPRARDEE